MLSQLLQLENIPEEGLKERALDGGDEHMSEPLDNSVMQTLLSKCKALNKLQMTEMKKLPEMCASLSLNRWLPSWPHQP